MRSTKIVAAAMVLACPAGAARAQAAAQPTCPAFEVDLQTSGEVLFLTAKPAVDGATFNWIVDAGMIEGGQGTNSLMLNFEGWPREGPVKIRLEISKLSCGKTVSIEGSLNPPPAIPKPTKSN